LIFQIKGGKIKTINLLDHTENCLEGTIGHEYDSLVFLEKKDMILAN
jgi:hypothetical protein